MVLFFCFSVSNDSAHLDSQKVYKNCPTTATTTKSEILCKQHVFLLTKILVPWDTQRAFIAEHGVWGIKNAANYAIESQAQHRRIHEYTHKYTHSTREWVSAWVQPEVITGWAHATLFFYAMSTITTPPPRHTHRSASPPCSALHPCRLAVFHSPPPLACCISS